MKKQPNNENIGLIGTPPDPAEKAETLGRESKCVYPIAAFFVTLLVLSGCVRRIVTGPDYSRQIDSFMGTYVGRSYTIYWPAGSLPVYDTVDLAELTLIRYRGDSFYKKSTSIGFNYNSSNYYIYYLDNFGSKAIYSIYPQLDSIFITSESGFSHGHPSNIDTFYGKRVR